MISAITVVSFGSLSCRKPVTQPGPCGHRIRGQEAAFAIGGEGEGEGLGEEGGALGKHDPALNLWREEA